MSVADLIKSVAVEQTNALCARHGLKPVYRQPKTQWTHLSFDNDTLGEGEYTIAFNYTPPAPAVLYPIDKAEEGSPAVVDLVVVRIGSTNVLHILGNYEIERIKNEIIDSMDDSE
jgi:hypothetical protein